MKLSKLILAINSDGFARKYTLAVVAGYALLAATPAFAQTSPREVAVSIFTALYVAVGAVCAIAVLLCGINWACGGALMGGHDPKKMFLQSVFGTALAFGVVIIIAGIKAVVNASSSGIGSL